MIEVDDGLTPRGAEVAAQPTLGLALALVALGMTALGRYLLVDPAAPWLVAAMLCAGAAAFIRLVIVTEAGRSPSAGERAEAATAPPLGARLRAHIGAMARALDPRGIAALPATISRAPLTAACVLLSLVLCATVAVLLHWRQENGLMSYWDIVGLWLISIGFFLAAALQPRRWLSRRAIVEALRRHRGALVDAGLLLGLALALRLIGLGQVPDVIAGDEGRVGAAGRELMAAGRGHIFGTIFGYGTVYLQAVGASLLGLGGGTGVAALRLPAALGGALAVPATYALGRQLFGRRVGLVAGLILATAHMHIHLSRIAIGQSIDTLTAAMALFAFARGLARRSVAWMAISGVWLGLAQYGYTAGRLIDLVIVAFVVSLWFIDPERLRGARVGIAAAFGAALVTAMPILRWAIDHSSEFFDRLDKSGFLQSGEFAARATDTGWPAWLILAVQAHTAARSILVLPALGFYGARLPMLDAIWGVFFLLGLGYALWRFRDWRFLLLLLDLAGGLALLTFGGRVVLAGYRALGVLPTIAVLAAFAIVMLAERSIRGLGLPERRASAALIAGAVAVMAVYNTGYYFGEYIPGCIYAANDPLMDPRTAASSIGGRFIAGAAESGQTILVLDSPDYDIAGHDTAMFFTQRRPARVDDARADVPAPGAPGADGYVYAVGPDFADLPGLVRSASPALVLAAPALESQLDAIATALPGGTRTTLSRCGKPMVLAYAVPAPDRR